LNYDQPAVVELAAASAAAKSSKRRQRSQNQFQDIFQKSAIKQGWQQQKQ